MRLEDRWSFSLLFFAFNNIIKICALLIHMSESIAMIRDKEKNNEENSSYL